MNDQDIRGLVASLFLKYDWDRSNTLEPNEITGFFNDIFKLMGDPNPVAYEEINSAMKFNRGSPSKEELYNAVYLIRMKRRTMNTMGNQGKYQMNNQQYGQQQMGQMGMQGGYQQPNMVYQGVTQGGNMQQGMGYQQGMPSVQMQGQPNMMSQSMPRPMQQPMQQAMYQSTQSPIQNMPPMQNMQQMPPPTQQMQQPFNNSVSQPYDMQPHHNYGPNVDTKLVNYIDRLYMKHDRDRSNNLDVNELAAVINNVMLDLNMGISFTQEEARQILSRIDYNKGGKVEK